jgi:class 3 adenylate cyclase
MRGPLAVDPLLSQPVVRSVDQVTNRWRSLGVLPTITDVAKRSAAAGAGRSTAIVLFTDLVGSTELRSRLGEQAAEDVRRQHDQLLTEAVEAHGGRVVKGLGDGIMATFPGASDAVAAAVAIQQAVDRLSRSPTAVAAIEVRVGLSAGDVTMEEEDLHGTPVIEAARLCGIAAGGQIIASELVRGLAGAAGGHEFRPLGAVELKGLPTAVAACEVGWDPLAVSSVPLPELLTDIGRIFVGREAELERLTQLWKEATAGERRVALLAGEPGVGKTRLAAELATRAHEEGALVLAGRCDEDLGVPYQPFVEALRHYVDHAAEVHLGRYGGELVRLVPELAERVPGLVPPLQSDSETERYRLFDAVAAWLGAASAQEPVVLLLDDLQWAAKPTLLLLRHVVRAPAARVLVLGIYRDSELTHDHPLVELVPELRRQGGVERLSLSGLDDLGVAAIVEQSAGRTLDEDGLTLARAIYEETEGNPFFVREVLRHLVETGAVERREGGWATRLPVEELGIPEGVRDVVGRRLARLDPDTNQVLRVAAVAGAEFEVPVLQASGVDEERLLAALEEAAAARLVIEASATRYRFAHALVRDILYEGLAAARRVSLHRRVAQAIETCHAGALGDYLPALAHHWARASAPAADTTRAVDYATRAGDRALAQLAHHEAVVYYRQALDLLDAAETRSITLQRCDLLLMLGEAQRQAGEPAYRETLLSAAWMAEKLGETERLARAAVANTRAPFPSRLDTPDPDRIDVLQRAAAALRDREDGLRARVLAVLALESLRQGPLDERRRISDEAMAIARRLDDVSTLVSVLIARYFTIAVPATIDERLRDTGECLRLAARIEDPAVTAQASMLRYRATMESGDADEADRCLELFERAATEAGQPSLRWMSQTYRAGRLKMRGRLDEAERVIAKASDLAEELGQPDARTFYVTQMFYLRFEQGRLPEFEEGLALVAPVIGGWSFFRAMAVLLDCEAGRHQRARSEYEVLADEGFAAVPLDWAWLMTLATLAEAAVRLGDEHGAATLARLLAPCSNQVIGMGSFWLHSVAHALGMLATLLRRFDDAEAHFAAAATLHTRIAAPAWLARTRLEWARMVLARRDPGDAERARELLAQALATARELGLATVERRAVQLLPSP